MPYRPARCAPSITDDMIDDREQCPRSTTTDAQRDTPEREVTIMAKKQQPAKKKQSQPMDEDEEDY